MPEPTPKPYPLTRVEEDQCRQYVRDTEHAYVSTLLSAVDFLRAESAALRAAVAEAEKQRDEYAGMCDEFGIPRGAQHLADKVVSIMSNRVTEKLALTKERDALAAELGEARKATEKLEQTVEDAASAPGIEWLQWQLRLGRALDESKAARTAARKEPANDAARELDAGGGAGPAPSATPPASKEGEHP